MPTGRGTSPPTSPTTFTRRCRDWLDCVVGCAAAASMLGLEPIGAVVKPARGKERLKLSQLQQQAR